MYLHIKYSETKKMPDEQLICTQISWLCLVLMIFRAHLSKRLSYKPNSSFEHLIRKLCLFMCWTGYAVTTKSFLIQFFCKKNFFIFFIRILDSFCQHCVCIISFFLSGRSKRTTLSGGFQPDFKCIRCMQTKWIFTWLRTLFSVQRKEK